jgi:hypothetical protein
MQPSGHINAKVATTVAFTAPITPAPVVMATRAAMSWKPSG